jgi:hypothetical protein
VFTTSFPDGVEGVGATCAVACPVKPSVSKEATAMIRQSIAGHPAREWASLENIRFLAFCLFL